MTRRRPFPLTRDGVLALLAAAFALVVAGALFFLALEPFLRRSP